MLGGLSTLMDGQGSVVGVRAVWTCAKCKVQSYTYQVVFVRDAAPLELPMGWSLQDGLSVCAASHRALGGRLRE